MHSVLQLVVVEPVSSTEAAGTTLLITASLPSFSAGDRLVTESVSREPPRAPRATRFVTPFVTLFVIPDGVIPDGLMIQHILTAGMSRNRRVTRARGV